MLCKARQRCGAAILRTSDALVPWHESDEELNDGRLGGSIHEGIFHMPLPFEKDHVVEGAL